MGDLASALNTAFDEEREAPAPEPATPAPEPVVEGAGDTSGREAEAAEPETKEQKPAPVEDEPTGDVLLDKLTPEEIAAVKADPKMRKIYAGLMRSYTPKMQALAEQQRLWEALNNPQTQRQAVEALARAAGIQVEPTDKPQREKAASVADDISDEWSKVVGPEAATLLRPLIEKTALAAINGTLQPLQQATEHLQLDAKSRQAEAQVSQFRTEAQTKGWTITPEVEARMAELGQQVLPAKPIESVQEGVRHLERLYRLATADTAEQDVEKRILERMKAAAQTAEPARGVPSTGREKRSNITREMDLKQALDVAFEEEAPLR